MYNATSSLQQGEALNTTCRELDSSNIQYTVCSWDSGTAVQAIKTKRSRCSYCTKMYNCTAYFHTQVLQYYSIKYWSTSTKVLSLSTISILFDRWFESAITKSFSSSHKIVARLAHTVGTVGIVFLKSKRELYHFSSDEAIFKLITNLHHLTALHHHV